ncbi:MAG: sensor histidine kinase [Planctomycetaceae bacterium]
MRRLRYALLGAFVFATIVVLAALAAEGLRAAAREEASRLAAALGADLRALREHALLLAREPADYAPTHLAAFRGLARARRYDAGGVERARVERLGDLVAMLPDDRLDTAPRSLPPMAEREVTVSDFESDAERRDVSPALRNVLHYATPIPGDGALILTVYAEPFLAPLRAAGAELLGRDGLPRLGAGLGASAGARTEEGWEVRVPVTLASGRTGHLAGLAALGLGVLLLAGAALLLSERQIRGQERAALDARLAQGEKLRSLGLLVAGIAHEINNPLEGIVNWLRLGRGDKVEEGLDRIRTIVKDLLAFARPPAAAQSADVRASLDRALDLARYAAVFAGTRVECDAAPGLIASAGAPALEQVFLNLLLNAGKAMGGGPGAILEISARREAERLVVRFRDRGPGIAPDDLPRLFDPFFSRTGGTGLGLSVSYGILKALGGDLRADNPPGGGALFTVELIPK